MTFNIAFSVLHISGQIKYGCFLSNVINRDEAIGKGMEYARRLCPFPEGWYSHAATAEEVSTEILLECLADNVGTSIYRDE